MKSRQERDRDEARRKSKFQQQRRRTMKDDKERASKSAGGEMKRAFTHMWDICCSVVHLFLHFATPLATYTDVQCLMMVWWKGGEEWGGRRRQRRTRVRSMLKTPIPRSNHLSYPCYFWVLCVWSGSSFGVVWFGLCD